MRSTRHLAVTAAVFCAVGVSACGSSDKKKSDSNTTPASTAAQSSSGGTDLQIKATETSGLSFDKKTLTAKAGSVTLDMANPSGNSTGHAIAIEGNGVDKDGQVVQPGGSDSTVTVDLKPGTYTFYCPVPGHEDAGMKGTLTVQ